jgi:hypothetical protein
VVTIAPLYMAAIGQRQPVGLVPELPGSSRSPWFCCVEKRKRSEISDEHFTLLAATLGQWGQCPSAFIKPQGEFLARA